MLRAHRISALLLVVAVLWLPCPGFGQEEDRVAQWQTDGWALLQEFCIECHNADYQEAEIDLSPFEDLKHAEENAELWSHVLQMIRFGAMPPDDAPLPTDEQRRQLGDALDHAIYNVTCDLTPKAGRVTARRLNRVEYNRTIRELFGMEIDLTSDFPSDEVGGGFDNNADVLAMPPMLLEKYLDAAERVASTVLLDPDSIKKESLEVSGERFAIVGEGFTESFYGRLFTEDSFGWMEFELESAGVYRVRISGSAAHAERSPQGFAIYDAAGQAIFAGAFQSAEGGGSHSATFNHEFPAGTTRLLIGVVDAVPENLSDLPVFPHLARLDEAAIAAGREQFEKSLEIDRQGDWKQMAFVFRKLNLDGPTQFPKEMLPPSQDKIVRRVASRRGNAYVDVEKAARECLEPLMQRAFRGPVDAETVDRYAALVKAATDRGGSYYRGLQDAITAILVSPQFLFRVELPAPDAQPDEQGEFRLNDYQLATRLSYFLWSSMPDDELLELAKQNKLSDPQVLDAQVDRMLRDSRSDSLSEQFASQWLGLRNLDGISRDPEAFPQFDEALVRSMTIETQRLFAHAVRENLPIGELLGADFTFVDRRLAEFYGLPWNADWRDDAFHRVSLSDSPRRGILTHASVLTLTSYPTRTSPVMRGKWILESVLGTPPPDPPANVPPLEDTSAVAATASMREQLAIHRANPSCASCHRVMDQLGFGFEDFDAIGRYRGDEPVDAAGELPGGRAFDGGKQLAEILRNTESTRFAATVTEKLLAFALGRELTPADRCVTEQVAGACSAEDYRLADVIKQVIASRPFQYFQVEPGAHDDSN